MARRLKEIKDNTDVANLEKHRQEIEEKSRAIKASTEDLTRQHRDLEASMVYYNNQIEEKNKCLTILQQKTAFLNKSVTAFENVLKERSASKPQRRNEDDRLLEIAKKEAEIIELTVRLEMAKREVAEKEETEKWNKIKLLDYQHKINLENDEYQDDLYESEITSNKGSIADTLTYEGNDHKTIKSMSVISESELIGEHSCKHMSMYDGPKQPLKFAKPNLIPQAKACVLDESTMSEFELELYNSARAAKPVLFNKDSKNSTESTTMVGKRSMLKSVITNVMPGKKSNYVDAYLPGPRQKESENLSFQR